MSEPIEVWTELEDLLGRKLLISLLGISESKLRRYKAKPKSIPLGIFSRIEFLIELTDILKDGDNPKGVRAWFKRARAQFNGRSPAEILKNDWSPSDPGPLKVFEMARKMNA